MTSPFDHAWAILKQDEKPAFPFDDPRYTGETPPVSQQSSDFPNQGTLDAWGVPSTTMLGPTAPPAADPEEPAGPPAPWWSPKGMTKPKYDDTGKLTSEGGTPMPRAYHALGAAMMGGKWLGRKLGVRNPFKGLRTSAQREAAANNMIEPYWGDE